MNKKIILYSVLAFILFFTTAAVQMHKECDGSALKAELKSELKRDFKYDSSNLTLVTYGSKAKVKEIEVPLFMGEKYRFLFNTAGLPIDIDVKIYNKSSTNKKRTLLYSLEPKEGKHIYVFEPEKSRKMYITYTIPKSVEKELKGCIVLLIGYNYRY